MGRTVWERRVRGIERASMVDMIYREKSDDGGRRKERDGSLRSGFGLPDWSPFLLLSRLLLASLASLACPAHTILLQ
jgi:hypothetical protein